jgi:hypothetical protein
MMQTLYVQGYGHIAPHARLADFPAGAEIELPKPDLGLLARTLRRGLSDVTRLFMHAAQQALASAQLNARDVHVVFASAFGEISTAEALLQQAYDEDAASPLRFRHSVHNSAPGLLSISAQNFRPATALAAGWNTVAMALCEVSALLCSGVDRVLLVFADERVPKALSAEHSHGSLAAAFVLTRAPETPLGRIHHARRVTATRELDALSDPFAGANHPIGPALLLAHALEERACRTIRVGDGPEPWCVDVDARGSRVNP